MISDDETALRMVWQPGDFTSEGKLKGAHFSRSDLLPNPDRDGNPRYVSMDRHVIVCRPSVDWRIRKAADPAKKRVNAKFAEFERRQLHTAGDTGLALFALVEVPLDEHADGPGSPENRAHMGVRSLTPCPETDAEKELKVNELRTHLLACRRATLTYAEVFPENQVA